MHRLRVLALCWLGLALLPLQAQPLLQLAPDAKTSSSGHELLPWMSFWVEAQPAPAPAVPPAALVSSSAFQPAIAAALTPGYTRAAYWVKLRLHNPLDRPMRRVLLVEPARLESVNLYWQDARDGSWQRSRAGTDQPFEARELPLRDQAFALELAPGEERTLLLRVSSRSALALRASLWMEGPLLQRQQGLLWFDGLLHSLGVVAGVIALLLGLSQRSAGYALVGLYMGSATLYEASMRGTSFMLMWPQATDWAQRSLGGIGLLATLIESLALRQLLALRSRQPRLNLWLLGLMALSVALFLQCLFGDYHLATQLANPVNTALALFGLLAAVRATRMGDFMGWIWAVALCTQMLGLLPRFLVLIGVIPHVPTLDYLGNFIFASGGLVVVLGIVVRIAQERRRHALGVETEVRQRTAELANATAELRARNKAKGRLLGYIGHDLRAPMLSVLQLTRHLQPGPEFEDNRRAIEQGSRLLLDTINELERFAHQPDAVVAAEALPAPLYLHGLLRDAAAQAQALLRSHGQHLRLQIASDLPGVVSLDGRRLRQVLFNLLSNAAKYGAGAPVLLEAWSEDNQLRIAVQDQGPGIPLQEQALVFEPFLRRNADAGQPGLGLGLSIARQTTREMGGELGLFSEPGRGSRFTMTLPLTLSEESQVLWPVPQADVMGPMGDGVGAVVLDACTTAADALSERLLLAGFEVECCHAANQLEAALQRLAARAVPRLLLHEPALISALPGGPEACVARWPRLQLLGCAATPASDEVLAKPVSDEDWRTALQPFLLPQTATERTDLSRAKVVSLVRERVVIGV
jgi:two-component system, sensor histidine kinase LadS